MKKESKELRVARNVTV